MEQTDIWSINPSTSTTQFLAATDVTGGVFPRALSLVAGSTPTVAKEGAGYQLIFTCVGAVTSTFTINGAVVGELNNKVPSAAATTAGVPEVIQGVTGGTVTSAHYYSRIDSIVVSAAVGGATTIAIGTTGALALPRCRIKGFYIVGGGTAGSLKANIWSFATGSAVDQGNILDISTPAGATLTQFLSLPGQGILTGRQQNDYAVVTAAVLTDYTLFCG